MKVFKITLILIFALFPAIMAQIFNSNRIWFYLIEFFVWAEIHIELT